MKVLGDAPAIPMGNLFATATIFGSDPRLVTQTAGLFDALLDIPAETPPKAAVLDGLYAETPVASFDGRDGGEQDRDGGGREGGHRESSEGSGDGAGMTTALSLFKGFGHGDLDL